MTGREYMGLVKQCRCVLCEELGQQQQTHTSAHHARAEQGMAQRSSDFLTVALCHDCHQGPLGVHGDRTLLKLAKVSELDLVGLTIKQVVEGRHG